MEKEIKKQCYKIVYTSLIIFLFCSAVVRILLGETLEDNFDYGVKLIFTILTIIGTFVVYYTMKCVNNVWTTPPKEFDYLLSRLEHLRRESVINDWNSGFSSGEKMRAGLCGLVEYKEGLPILQLVVTQQNQEFALKLAWWAFQNNRQCWRIVVQEIDLIIEE